MSYSGKLAILLDSTYLLPIVGVEVEGIEKALKTLKKLRNAGVATYYYTPFNLLEILGKLAKTRYPRDRVAAGLLSIEEQLNLTHPTPNGYLKALKLRSKGFRDLIDLLLYTTSLTKGLTLLTRDEELVEFLRRHGEKTENILLEEELIAKYG